MSIPDRLEREVPGDLADGTSQFSIGTAGRDRTGKLRSLAPGSWPGLWTVAAAIAGAALGAALLAHYGLRTIAALLAEAGFGIVAMAALH